MLRLTSSSHHVATLGSSLLTLTECTSSMMWLQGIEGLWQSGRGNVQESGYIGRILADTRYRRDKMRNKTKDPTCVVNW